MFKLGNRGLVSFVLGGSGLKENPGVPSDGAVVVTTTSLELFPIPGTCSTDEACNEDGAVSFSLPTSGLLLEHCACGGCAVGGCDKLCVSDEAGGGGGGAAAPAVAPVVVVILRSNDPP